MLERPAEVVDSHGTIAACDKRPLHHVVLFWIQRMGLGEVEQSERRMKVSDVIVQIAKRPRQR